MKKLFFGVAVVAIALSTSAFTNIAIGDYYVYDEVNDRYVLISANSFNPINCQLEAEVCAYEVLTEESLPAFVSSEEILDLKINDIDDAVTEVVNPVTLQPILGAYIL